MLIYNFKSIYKNIKLKIIFIILYFEILHFNPLFDRHRNIPFWVFRIVKEKESGGLYRRNFASSFALWWWAAVSWGQTTHLFHHVSSIMPMPFSQFNFPYQTLHYLCFQFQIGKSLHQLLNYLPFNL